MAKEINLLPNLIEAEIKRTKYKRLGSLVSFGLIGLAAVVIVGLFLWSFLINRSISAINVDLSNREKSIADKSTTELKLRALNSKIQKLTPLMNQEFYYSEVLKEVLNVTTPISNLQVSEINVTGQSVSVSAVVPNSAALQEFFASLLEPTLGAEHFNQVVLTSLARSKKEADYRFSLQMRFKPTPSGGDNGSAN